MIQSQQVTLTGDGDKINELLWWLKFHAKEEGVTVTLTPTSVPDATVGVTRDSQQKSRQSSECVCCGVSLADGEVSTDAPELPCGCRWCWHCGDNRGRYEGHDPKACSEQSQQKSRQDGEA